MLPMEGFLSAFIKFCKGQLGKCTNQQMSEQRVPGKKCHHCLAAVWRSAAVTCPTEGGVLPSPALCQHLTCKHLQKNYFTRIQYNVDFSRNLQLSSEKEVEVILTLSPAHRNTSEHFRL